MAAPSPKSSSTAGIKALMATLSLVITMGGWAILARLDKSQLPVTFIPSATSEALILPTPTVAGGAVQPIVAAQPTLRVVTAPVIAPVVTRSSR